MYQYEYARFVMLDHMR